MHNDLAMDYATLPELIALGRIPEMSKVNKFGGNPAIAADTTEDVWDGGGTYPFPTTADITHLSQAVDQAAMRGESVEVQGLDANWALTVQNVVLDASATTTAVALATPLIRVFRMKVLADVVADQNITLKNVGGGTTYAQITTPNNQTLMAIYTVPAGKQAWVTGFYATVVDATSKTPTSTRFCMWLADRENGYEFQLKHMFGIPEAGPSVVHQFNPWAGPFPAKTDLKVTANPVDQAGDVAAGFDIILEDV